MRRYGRRNVGCIDLEKVYERVNRETLGLVLRMYDVGSNLLNGV